MTSGGDRSDGPDLTAPGIRDHFGKMAALHRAYLEGLATAEQRFLELRAVPPHLAGVASRAPGRHAPQGDADPLRLGPVDPPAVACQRRDFDDQALRALWEGRVLECFGPGFEWADTHSWTPRIGAGSPPLLSRVGGFDVAGGRWGRGYLQALFGAGSWEAVGPEAGDVSRARVTYLDAATQAMEFYLTALGHTLERDAWRFEPLADGGGAGGWLGPAEWPRGDVVCDLDVLEVIAAPIPSIRAAVTFHADGVPVFRLGDVGVRLVPAWPLDTLPHLIPTVEGDRAVASMGGVPFDERASAASALGRPSEAYGALAGEPDGPRKGLRLPAPPLSCVTRITRFEGPEGRLIPGIEVEAEFDVPPDAWYFDEGRNDAMPFVVLLEAALQPTGVLAVYGGATASATEGLHYRNLDGSGSFVGEVRRRPEIQRLRTVARLVRAARSGATTILSFHIQSDLDGVPVLSLDAAFGIFTGEGLAGARGLPDVPYDDPTNAEPDGAAALTGEESARLPGGRLRLLDRVTGYWPEGGRQGLGRIRAERTIRPGDWYFKAHFFQDPVQPGSLGLEALLQLTGTMALRRGLDAGMRAPRFESVVLGRPIEWKYRGQVLPSSRLVTLEAEVTELISDGRGPGVVAVGRLFVDGLCIYEASGLGVRLIDETPSGPPVGGATPPEVEVLDPAIDRWVLDHRPNFVVPALPLMSMVDRLAAAGQRTAPDRVVIGLEDVRVEQLLALDTPRRLRTEAKRRGDMVEVTLSAWREARRAELSRFVPIARGRALLASDYPAPPAELPPLEDAQPRPLPYDVGEMPHGPAFRVMVAVEASDAGATVTLDAGAGTVPRGFLGQALLDGLVQAVPHLEPTRWWPKTLPGVVGIPQRIPELRLYGPPPREGVVLCHIRADGYDGDARFPAARIQAVARGRVWLEMRLVDALTPGGLILSVPGPQRRAFFHDRVYVPDAGVSRPYGAETIVTLADLGTADRLKGTVAGVYGVGDLDPDQLARAVVVRDHVARLARIHPSHVRVLDASPSEGSDDPTRQRVLAIAGTDPPVRHLVTVEAVPGGVRARSAAARSR